MAVASDNEFRTSETALAAYLISEGFGTPEIDYNGTKASFTFIKQDPKIEEAIREYDAARAIGNIVLFFNAYQTLLRRIRERY